MQPPDSLRADQFLHHVRVFKTRSLAAQACTKGNVVINGAAIKPARSLRSGDVLQVTRGDLVLHLRVIALPPQRVGPPRMAEFCEDLTDPAEREKAAALRRERALISPPAHETAFRPNKKQLRELRQWRDQAE